MAVVTIQRSTHIQGLTSLLKGSPELSENNVTEVLRQIVLARQEGRFPLSEELVQDCCDLVNQVWKTYETIQGVPANDLNTRCILLFCDFFSIVTKSPNSVLADEPTKAMQESYLLQMQEEGLSGNSTVEGWLKNFAIVSCKR